MTSAARAAPAGEGPDAALAWFAEHETDPTAGSPNAFAYTALIDAQAKGGAPEDAFETFERMKRAGVAPTVVTFGCLLNACRLADFVDGGAESARWSARTRSSGDERSRRVSER